MIVRLPSGPQRPPPLMIAGRAPFRENAPNDKAAYPPNWGTWFLPTRPFVARLAAAGPLLELGAGLGLVAAAVKDAGGDVVATDPQIYHPAHGGTFGLIPPYTRVLRLAAEQAVERYHDRHLLIIAPVEDQLWPAEAVAKAARPGRLVFLVGEDRDEICFWLKEAPRDPALARRYRGAIALRRTLDKHYERIEEIELSPKAYAYNVVQVWCGRDR